MFSRVSLSDKAEFYENVANLLDGGVTLLDALRGFYDRVENTKLKQEVNNLLFFTESGDAVSMAMRKLPNFFTEQEVAIVEAGEQSGNIQSAFSSLAADLRDQEDLRRKIVSASIYPFIIFLFLILAVTIVMIYVVPQLAPILADTGNIPFTTRTLIATSDFLKAYFFHIVVFLTAIILIIKAFSSTPSGRLVYDTLLLKLPAVGRVYRNYLIVRYASTLSLLMSAGITILKVFKLTGESTGNAYANMIFKKTAAWISHGNKIHVSMRDADMGGLLFTPNILQMIEAWEKTSTIDTVTQKISMQYRREVEVAITMMVKFIEPAAILIAWLFVLWFALAIFSIIMQITSSTNVL